MKTIIFKLFKVFFKNELKKFCTAQTHLIFVKKGKIRETRFYDENFKRLYNFELDKKNNRIIFKQ
jgi:hypothetical protein